MLFELLYGALSIPDSADDVVLALEIGRNGITNGLLVLN